MDIKTILNSEFNNIDIYMNYFFYNILKLSIDKKIFYAKTKNHTITLLRNDKTHETKYTNFSFYFINKKNYENLFGVNKKKRNILNKGIVDGVFNLSNWNISYKGNLPNNLNINPSNNYKIVQHLYNKMVLRNQHVLLDSTIYIVLILFDSSNKISNNDFLLYQCLSTTKLDCNVVSKIRKYINHSVFERKIEYNVPIVEDSYKSIIDFVKAYSGEYNLSIKLKENYDEIISNINRGCKYIFINGLARSGKTIIAMMLLNKFKNANLVIVDKHFYDTLKDIFNSLKLTFPINRIFHLDADCMGYFYPKDEKQPKLNFSFFIIDECQRLNDHFINEILRQNDNIEHAFFIGDDNQQLDLNINKGLSFLKNEIKDKTQKAIFTKINNYFSYKVLHDLTKHYDELIVDLKTKLEIEINEIKREFIKHWSKQDENNSIELINRISDKYFIGLSEQVKNRVRATLNSKLKEISEIYKYDYINDIIISKLLNKIDEELSLIDKEKFLEKFVVKEFSNDIINEINIKLHLINSNTNIVKEKIIEKANKETYENIVEGFIKYIEKKKTYIIKKLEKELRDLGFDIVISQIINESIPPFEMKIVKQLTSNTTKNSIDKLNKFNNEYNKVEDNTIINDKYNKYKSKINELNIYIEDKLYSIMRDIIIDNKKKEYINMIIENECEYFKEFILDEAINVPTKNINNIRFLLGDPKIILVEQFHEHFINLYDDEDKFINAFNLDIAVKKCVATISITNNYNDFNCFKSLPNEYKNKGYLFFLENNMIDKYYFTPNELISYEVETIYIFLKEDIKAEDIENNVYMHLYVLMTRAKKSIHFYVKNEETRKLFENRLNEIEEFSISSYSIEHESE